MQIWRVRERICTMTTVLLTGASGYIGKHIALRLLNEGYSVRASVRTLAKGDEVRAAVLPHLNHTIDMASKLSFVELDLEKDAGWEDALKGVDVLMHTASPFPLASPKDENDLIKPAVEGTLRALKAAHASGVKRVVLTSSIAAIYGNILPAGKSEFDETMWTDVTHPIGRMAYTKSKTLAEKAAWDYIKSDAPEIELTTINPVLVLGAPLDNNFGASVSVIERMLKAKDPMVPDLSFSIVDVKDVALMHVKALSIESSKNERFIASARTVSFIEIAKILKSSYPKRKIVTMKAPNLVIRLLALFDSDIKSILPSLGDKTGASSRKAHEKLGINFISVEASIIETAAFLIKNGR